MNAHRKLIVNLKRLNDPSGTDDSIDTDEATTWIDAAITTLETLSVPASGEPERETLRKIIHAATFYDEDGPFGTLSLNDEAEEVVSDAILSHYVLVPKPRQDERTDPESGLTAGLYHDGVYTWQLMDWGPDNGWEWTPLRTRSWMPKRPDFNKLTREITVRVPVRTRAQARVPVTINKRTF
jgi:hypothetical protein